MAPRWTRQATPSTTLKLGLRGEVIGRKIITRAGLGVLICWKMSSKQYSGKRSLGWQWWAAWIIRRSVAQRKPSNPILMLRALRCQHHPMPRTSDTSLTAPRALACLRVWGSHFKILRMVGSWGLILRTRKVKLQNCITTHNQAFWVWTERPLNYIIFFHYLTIFHFMCTFWAIFARSLHMYHHVSLHLRLFVTCEPQFHSLFGISIRLQPLISYLCPWVILGVLPIPISWLCTKAGCSRKQCGALIWQRTDSLDLDDSGCRKVDAWLERACAVGSFLTASISERFGAFLLHCCWSLLRAVQWNSVTPFHISSRVDIAELGAHHVLALVPMLYGQSIKRPRRHHGKRGVNGLAF